MKKLLIIGVVVLGFIIFDAAGSISSHSQSSSVQNTQSTSTDSTKTTSTAKKIQVACDGTTVTTNCTVDGIDYTTYIYHPAVAEKSHTETVTTYKQEVTGYCTLCNDGTYSPSCATGRGTCSHHHGVAEWNAPEYSNVPVYSTKTVIDAPAQAAYYEKVAK